MLRMVRILQMTVRLTGLALIILGTLIWTGHVELRQAHMGLGVLFVLALWSLAGIGFRTRVGVGLATRAVLWGLVVLYFGMVQGQIGTGSMHVYIRILHLVVGLVAIGVAEFLAARIKRSHKGLQAAG
jgi:hypothetical protein